MNLDAHKEHLEFRKKIWEEIEKEQAEKHYKIPKAGQSNEDEDINVFIEEDAYDWNELEQRAIKEHSELVKTDKYNVGLNPFEDEPKKKRFPPKK